MSLFELLTAMAIATLVGCLLLATLAGFRNHSLTAISRNDLQDRGERLLRFIADDLAGAAFLTGARPRQADGTPLVLVHDSQSGDPPVSLPWAILPDNGVDGDDSLTIVKGVGFFPPLRTAQAAPPNTTTLLLERRPNRAPGSSREILPAPKAINHVVFANHRSCYSARASGLVLTLDQPSTLVIPAGTELFGVRAHRFSREPAGGSGRLLFDNFTSREILDDAVDGLQLQYLRSDGTLVDQPADLAALRGIKIFLLIRAPFPDHDYRDQRRYQLADQSYGPFGDGYRRCVVSTLVEVKNHGLP